MWPQVKKNDYPPIKKCRTMQPTLEVHVSINITPTPGAASSVMQATYQVSGPTSSAPCPLYPDIKPFSSPGPSRPLPSPRCAQLLTTLDCHKAARIPSLCELLSLMDHKYPAANPRIADGYLELKDLTMEDAVDIYTMPVEFLATMGKLREDSARCLHEYCRGLLLPTLGIMEIKRSCEEEASVEEIPPPRVPVAVKHEPCTRSKSVEEIPPPQTCVKKEKEPHTACRVQVESQPIREEVKTECIFDWLDRVSTEVNAEEEDKEDGNKDDGGSTATSCMAMSKEV
jgi:hypothetical protein